MPNIDEVKKDEVESGLRATLKLLMFNKNMTVSSLSRAVRLPQQTIQRIASGITAHPNLATLLPIAEHFKVSIEQLQGLDPIPWLDLGTLKNRYVSLIGWEDIEDYLNKKKVRSENTSVDLDISNSGFALTMNDISMTPIFPNGTILIFDPFAEVKDNGYLLVRLNEKNCFCFRQIIVRNNRKYLRTLNQDEEIFKLIELNEKDKIIAVLVQAKMIF